MAVAVGVVTAICVTVARLDGLEDMLVGLCEVNVLVSDGDGLDISDVRDVMANVGTKAIVLAVLLW